MSAFAIAVVPLTKTVASLVMATSVSLAGIGDASTVKKIDLSEINERPAIEAVQLETPKQFKKVGSVFSIKGEHNHDDHVDMVIPGCPHCMGNKLAPHPDWLPNLVRSAENEFSRILSVKDKKGEVIDLKFKNRPLRLPPVTSLQPVRLPAVKADNNILKVPRISRPTDVSSVPMKEKPVRIEHLQRSFTRAIS